ncbi:MAG: RagB/SusD family nutrient uptake outer membrane protein [Candidatus Cryptobacteroides sp.]
MNKNILIVLAAAILLCSCEKMFKPKPVGEVSTDVMWTVPDMARGVLMNAYSSMPARFDTFDGNYLDVATDNAVTNSFNGGIYRLSLGSLSSTNNPLGVWSQCYDNFQNIHMFLNYGLTDNTRYVPDSEEQDAAEKRNLKAEAFYLRAWWGAYLLKYHGGRTLDGQALGYPIVTDYVSLEEASDLKNIRRNTYEECVAQICEDCDSASKVLPLDATGAYIGRATAKMAEFLKARVLVDAASPAYQPADIVQINGMGDFTVVDEAAYLEKWERAALQCAKVLSICGNPSYIATKRTDMVDVDQNNPVTPSHFIFRYYALSNGTEGRHFPPYYFGNAQSAPTQNLVDAYPMKANGYPVTDAASGYDPQNPYAGRDDRFEFTVYHHGSKFGENDSYIDVVEGGKDAQSFMSGGNRASRTGYYLHKAMSERADMLNPVQSVNALHFYPMMRLAEIFLDLAEAMNELYGPEGTGSGLSRSAYSILKDIRAKSGGIENDLYIETVKDSQDKFRDLILNERRLEFAFENFRFWDLRRRLLPLRVAINGVNVTRNEEGALSYEVKEIETRDFDNIRYYYLPVPYSEMKKCPNLLNNMDY